MSFLNFRRKHLRYLGLTLIIFGVTILLATTFRTYNHALITHSNIIEDNTQQTSNNTTNVLKETNSAKASKTLVANDDSTLLLIGEVGFDNSEALANQIALLNDSKSSEPILLIIDSPGGAVFGGSKVIAAINGSKRPVYTICKGLCASMGAMIHSYGTKRLMVDNATLMFHNAAGGVNGNLPQMYARLNYINTFVKKMELNVCRRSGMKYVDYKILIANEFWVESSDAVANKFADEIINLDVTKLTAPSSSGINLKAINKNIDSPLSFIKEIQW